MRSEVIAILATVGVCVVFWIPIAWEMWAPDRWKKNEGHYSGLWDEESSWNGKEAR